LQRVPAKGFVLSVPVNLPIDLPADQAVRIRASYRGGILRLFPPRPVGPAVTIDVAFADIPTLPSPGDPFSAAQPMTVRREAADASSTILRFYVAGQAGHLAITASAPGVTPVTASRMVF